MNSNARGGWYSNGSNYWRIYADKPWYCEFKNSKGDVWLSPVTVTFLYLHQELTEYDVEHTMCSLTWEKDVQGSRTKMPVTDDGFINMAALSGSAVYDKYHTFVIKYEDLTITNNNGDTDYFDDFYMLLRMNHRGQIRICGWRQTIPYNHYSNMYLHSHLGSYGYNNGFNVKSFCTGSSYTRINQAKRRFQDVIIGYHLNLSRLFIGDKSKVDKDKFEIFETKISELTGAFLPLIQHESLEGGPYMHIANNRGGLVEASTNNRDFDDFARLIALNAEDKRLRFDIGTSSITVKDGAGLVSFAKEYGYFEKCFGYKSGTGRSYIYDVGDKMAHISPKEFLSTKKAAMFCQSPFRWEGSRLPINLVPKSKTIANEKSARINTSKRTYFDSKLTNHFKAGLRLQNVQW